MKSSRPRNNQLRTLVVRRSPNLPGSPGPRGHLRIGTLNLTCALGGSGITYTKREGDRGTPAGRMKIVRGFYRPDRLSRPRSHIEFTPLRPDLGWCDEPGSPLYNRLHTLPLRPSHEVMWRKDELYDLVFVLDYNLARRRAGRGSAIFFHCARPDFEPTLGCIALKPADMRRLLPRLSREAWIVVR